MNPLIMFLLQFHLRDGRLAVGPYERSAISVIHLLVTVMVVLAGYYFSISRTEWCFYRFA